MKYPHWSQEVMLTVKIRAPLVKAAAIPSDIKVLSFCSDENSLIHIRKTIHSKLFLENQQTTIFSPVLFLWVSVMIFTWILYTHTTLIQFSGALELDHWLIHHMSQGWKH
ncbi:hypothetical protein H920_11970 [Fukomys damarensis]|uniref:Uncharacterized protein n=1 Tax=Fukomys damarensis TaxID=885580 RepID=A0A091DUV6_FUKDA|nr:hypothetical protein H920_11970 [Fukomys damarensis]